MVTNNYIEVNCKNIEKIIIKKINLTSRIAIVGIGNEFRHDDIAGLQVVRNLKEKSSNLEPKFKFLLIEGETAPHFFLNEIHDWNPTHLIMIDSADLKKAPGTIEIIQKEELPHVSISSHSGSKQLLLDFLTASFLKLEIIIIGIQAENINFEIGTSEKIQKAIDKLTDLFLKLIFK